VEPYGKSSLLRNVVLRLGPDIRQSNRQNISQLWSPSLRVGTSRNGFPALERMILDLNDWRPHPGTEEEEALNVSHASVFRRMVSSSC